MCGELLANALRIRRHTTFVRVQTSEIRYGCLGTNNFNTFLYICNIFSQMLKNAKIRNVEVVCEIDLYVNLFLLQMNYG